MESVALALPTRLFNRLMRFAASVRRKPEDIVEAVLSDSMEPDAPDRLRVVIDCSRCGVVPHRYVRSVQGAPGEFDHVYGCRKCYRLRKYGTVQVKGWSAASPETEEPSAAPSPEPDEEDLTAPWCRLPADASPLHAAP